MRKLTAIAIALGAFIAGGLLGFFICRGAYQGVLSAYLMANVDHMSTYVMIQRFQGTPQAYEAMKLL